MADSDHEEGEGRPRQLGGVTYQKILTPKSRSFEVLTRANPDNQQNIPLYLSQPFQAEYGPQPVYLFADDFKNVFHNEPQVDIEDKMFSSFIVGWTTETNITHLVNPTQLGDLAQDVVPMTDTIFPVMVSGRRHQPLSTEILRRDLAEYEPGTYLVLLDNPGVGSITVQVVVNKQYSLHNFNANTYSAELELICLMLIWDERSQSFWKEFWRFGNIDRILDKDNASYGVFGMYGGGAPPSSILCFWQRQRAALLGSAQKL